MLPHNVFSVFRYFDLTGSIAALPYHDPIRTALRPAITLGSGIGLRLNSTTGSRRQRPTCGSSRFLGVRQTVRAQAPHALDVAAPCVSDTEFTCCWRWNRGRHWVLGD
jgi:hypothetical protein